MSSARFYRKFPQKKTTTISNDNNKHAAFFDEWSEWSRRGERRRAKRNED
jgi:hypothetical protein